MAYKALHLAFFLTCSLHYSCPGLFFQFLSCATLFHAPRDLAHTPVLNVPHPLKLANFYLSFKSQIKCGFLRESFLI